MTDKKLLIAVLVLLASNIFCVAGWNSSINQVDTYHAYYKGAEELLDTLENHYGWVDAIDNDAYYAATSKLGK